MYSSTMRTARFHQSTCFSCRQMSAPGGGVQRLRKYRFPLKRQTETTESITLSQICWHAVINYFLPPANEVSEGYVFTGVCSGRSKGSEFFHFHAVFSK